MSNPLWLVIKREYIKVVRRPSFWISTLLFPTFLGIVMLVSGYSTQTTEDLIAKQAEEASVILILDQSGLINEEFYTDVYQPASDPKTAINQVKNAEADALIIYPADVTDKQEIQIYAQDKGLLSRGSYNDLATQLLRQSILQQVDNPAEIALFNTELNTENTVYNESGEEIESGLESFVVPVVSIVVYFLLTMLASGYLLLSVSEEKENRMIETIMSIIKSRDLIWGKILGLTGVAFTQLAILTTFAAIAFIFASDQLPIEIDLSAIEISLGQILAGVFYTITGFLIMASTMVGVGAAMPSYRDAQSFSSFFIIASIFPIYFITLLIAEPTGTLAQVTSYLPFTAPFILVFRAAMDALTIGEIVISSVVVIGYVIAGFYVSFKLFELGALEYNQKLNWRRVLQLFH